jgi:site-specific DNA-methyltransferase (adenine-specific)
MQATLFGEEEAQGLSIELAASTANVSTATIRNWIKTGYLMRVGRGLVSQASLQNFMADVAGTQKLNARANKQRKDTHNHGEVSKNVDALMYQYKGEQIGIEYERSLSDSHRNKEGIYYTPSAVVKNLFANIDVQANFTFIDPCCGSGNFLLEAIRQGVAPDNVYGYDVDANAVRIAKQRIKEEFGVDTVNVKVGDFLQEAIQCNKAGTSFDLIFTNPPWGKKIDRSAKERYAKIYGCGTSIDTTSLFFGACLSVLEPAGYLGFLIQEAFFNITTFEDIRRKVLAKHIVRFVDYGKAFKGLMTKAQGIVLRNESSSPAQVIECGSADKVFTRTIQSFAENPKSIFNFWTNESEAAVIKQMYTVEHSTLRGNAKWALGIVTGNNDRFCIKEERRGYSPIYKGSDITKSGLKEPSTFIVKDFSNFQQVAPLDMYHAKEKLIYKFISSDLCFYCDTNQSYILNSANMLILSDIGISGQQLTMLLNSSIMNWLFKKVFSTHKVLRGDLELLPLHLDYFAKHTEFTESNYLNYLKITSTSDGTYRVKG